MDSFYIATLVFAAAVIFYAYFRQKIDYSAVLASLIVGAITLLTVGVEWLYLIIAFFVFGNLVTKYKYALKEAEGVAERTRTFKNVFGNGGAAMIFALAYTLSGASPVFLFGFLGSMAAACADTFATELGEVFERRPWMITTMKRMRFGTSGAVSLPGFIAAIAGAALISLVPTLFRNGLDKNMMLLIGTIAGCVGCIVDSLVGATAEGKIKIIDNHMTNFIGTLAGGVAGIILFFLVF